MFSVHVFSSDGSIDAAYVFSRVPCLNEIVEVPQMGVTIGIVRAVRHYANVDPQAAVVARVDIDILP